MKHLTKSIFLTLILLVLSLNVSGQRRPELALLVENAGEKIWEIPAFNEGGGGTSGFKRIRDWTAPAGQPQVVELNFKIRLDVNVVETSVLVRLANDKEVLIGTYRLRRDESVTVEDLSKVGLEPVKLTVVKNTSVPVDLPLPIQPLLENKTKSVQVTSFYRDPATPGNFQLTLRNLSTKSIIALDLFIPMAQGSSGQRSQSNADHPLITPGQTLESHVEVPQGGRTTSNGYVPDVPAQRTLIIRAVVFDDGTYDGLSDVAAEIAAERKGINMQRKAILTILQEISLGDAQRSITVDELKDRAYALNDIFDESVVEELIAAFPSLSKQVKQFLPNTVRQGLRQAKQTFLREIREFEQNTNGGPKETLPEWMKRLASQYEKGMAPQRISNVDIR